MSEIILHCPQCQRLLRVTEELIGRPVKCPQCNATFSVSAGGEEPKAVSVAVEPTQTPNLSPSPDQERYDSTADEEEEERPWEIQGRRDAEPHRGTLILVLGIISVVLSTLMFCSVGFTGLIGLPLGITAWVMGRRDLRKMREGRMDREGNGFTQAGLICGIIGAILGSIGVLCFLVYVGYIFTMVNNAPRNPVPPPRPAPVRPRPAPAPGQPGNRAVLQELPHGLRDRSAELA
jgi:predicted Zn finger-like uncharacterized protein